MLEKELAYKLKEVIINYGGKWYPESNNWDTIIQFNQLLAGVQFKLKLNVHSIVQCLLARGVDYKLLVINQLPEKYQDYLIILDRLKIIPILIDINEIKILFKSENPFWLLKYRHKREIELKLLMIDEEAGSKAPLRSTERNIFLVELELMMLAKDHRGVVSNIHTVIDKLGSIPKKYFYFDYVLNKWRFQLNNLPSKDYPHIKSALESKANHELRYKT